MKLEYNSKLHSDKIFNDLHLQKNLAFGENLQQFLRKNFASKIEFFYSTHPLPNCGWIVIFNLSQQALWRYTKTEGCSYLTLSGLHLH